MMTTSKIKNASSAAGYYAKENYYSQGTAEPATWFGKGAEKLGLTGVVNNDQFAQILDGTLPTGEQLGRRLKGERVHAPGWDLTFSAPKSISILALVGGDERLIEAHDRAVQSALAHLEKTYVSTRTSQGPVKDYERTGHIVAATFRHDVNRSQEPHLHTHGVIANVTELNGKMRSVESHTFMRKNVIFEMGLHYRQELAYAARQLGYEIQREKDGLFDIAGVPKELMDRYSSRSADVVDFLKHRDLTRETATAADRQKAVLYTRPWKRTVARDTLATTWHESSQQYRDAMQSVIDASRAQQHSADTDQRQDTRDRANPALEIVRRAAAYLSERQSRFTEESLRHRASELALGRATPQQIQDATNVLVDEGHLVPRDVIAPSPRTGADETVPGFTLPAMQEIETRMLHLEQQGRDALRSGLGRDEARQVVDQAAKLTKQLHGHEWTNHQRTATLDILTSNDRIVGIQGLAGTAKTTTVLATAAATWTQRGHPIVAMAPTAAAAALIGETLEVEGKTVQKFLAESAKQEAGGRPATATPHPIWIVDEASMVGVRDMKALFEQARFQGAKLVLAGDAKQLGSVPAGAAFRQLQSEGMKTAILEDIVRQSNTTLRQAVSQSVSPATAGKALNSIAHRLNSLIELGGANVDRATGQQQRYKAIADRYTSLDAHDRAQTLVLEPSRAGRRDLNNAIRRNLQSSGELSATNLPFTIYASANLTNGEKRDVTSYQPGMVLQLGRDQILQDEKFATGTYFRVSGRAGETLLLHRLDSHGAIIAPRAYPWVPAAQANKTTQVYHQEQRNLAVNDTIVWKINQPISGLKNNMTLTVKALTETKATLKRPTGEILSFDLRRIESRHWDHGYAQTLHAAQGQTAARSLIHAETFRVNLINTAAFYVAISRAKEGLEIYTNDRAGLKKAIELRAGQSPQSLDKGERRHTVEDQQTQKEKTFMETLRDLLDRGRGDFDRSRDAALKALLPDRQAETRAPDQRDPSKIPPIQKPDIDRDKDPKRSQSADQPQPDKTPDQEKRAVRAPVQYDME